MKPLKIVLIGAGSHSFGLMTLKDLMDTPQLRGNEVVLVDIAADKLARMEQLGKRMNENWQANLKIWSTTDRLDALPGADVVVTSVERAHYDMWQLDITVPEKHGCHRLYGENGGPGGMFHTLRQVPMLVDIARDIERCCPNAWMLNLSNPESRLCLAISKYTKVKNVGVCLGAYITQHTLATKVLGLKKQDVDIKIAGINHCHWVMDIRHTLTGEDLYPEVKRRIQTIDPKWESFSRECLKHFGYFPGPADTHVGEYFGWGWKHLRPEHTDWIFKGVESDKKRETEVEFLASGSGPMKENEMATFKGLLIEGGLRWQTIDILLSLFDNGNRYILSLNLPNDGYISNLPRSAVVEIPAIVGADKIYGLNMGALPPVIAGALELQCNIMELVVKAAVEGDHKAALEALILDPNVPSPDAAAKILEEMLVLQKDYLPQFK